MSHHQIDPDLVIVIATASFTADMARVEVTLDIKDGWFVRGVAEDDHISKFQLDVRGDNVAEVTHIDYPVAYHIDVLGDPEIIYWHGSVTFVADVKLKGPQHTGPLRVVLSYQPCTIGSCLAMQHAAVDIITAPKLS